MVWFCGLFQKLTVFCRSNESRRKAMLSAASSWFISSIFILYFLICSFISISTHLDKRERVYWAVSCYKSSGDNHGGMRCLSCLGDISHTHSLQSDSPSGALQGAAPHDSRMKSLPTTASKTGHRALQVTAHALPGITRTYNADSTQQWQVSSHSDVCKLLLFSLHDFPVLVQILRYKMIPQLPFSTSKPL